LKGIEHLQMHSALQNCAFLASMGFLEFSQRSS